ncbi:hypothetical protein GQ56_0108080 [Burkholderia paludis]|uniref:Uncharacterized protein n=1 Tax=Burkholderia paludis TaxID=1506587 RepID=A0A6P2RBG9_9BURK|nr:hypothetical protein GQ56_0108080 [Burkholderia paludis]VWC30322.1 hypothetical protein BPA30113_06249 [Burkholderia paludis]
MEALNPDDQRRIYFARVSCADSPYLDAVEIEGCGLGVLLIRYFAYESGSIEGDHWYENAAVARREAESEFGIRPESWIVRDVP